LAYRHRWGNIYSLTIDPTQWAGFCNQLLATGINQVKWRVAAKDDADNVQYSQERRFTIQ